MAILLVIIAVAMATILSVTFLSAQSTSLGIAQNLRRHPQAQQIAESGLATIVKQIEKDPQWRSRFTHGLWVNNQALLGGTVTIYGQDPLDSDLADNQADDLELRVIGTYQGVTHELKALLKFEAIVGGGAAKGVVTSGKIALTGSSQIDSYDSSKGAYGGSNVGSDATIVTTSTSNGIISLVDNCKLKGDAIVGKGGNPNTAISVEQPGNITGTKTALTDNLIWPGVMALPGGFGAKADSKSYGGNSKTTISSNLWVDDFTVANAAEITIQGNVSLRVDKSFAIKNNAEIKLDTNATLTVYVGEKIEFTNAGRLNTNTNNPSRVIIYGRGSGYEHAISNNTRVHAIIDCPTSKIKIENSAELFGAYLGTQLTMSGDASFHMDTNPAILTANPRLPSGSGGGGGGSGGSKLIQTQWLELP